MNKSKEEKEWKKEEPWVSILGALIDVEAKQATPDEALEWIRTYFDPSQSIKEKELKKWKIGFYISFYSGALFGFILVVAWVILGR